jgi:cytochrome oxidase Cu insertion factor (SCO1/SenC/PrrC family)
MQKTFPKIFAACLLAGLTAASSAPLFAQNKKEDSAMSMPKVGDTAPDFKLHYFDGNNLKDVSLSDYRGKKNVVLAFYIFAFTGG